VKPETRFWKWLSGGKLPEGHFCRVEPPPTPGIPDVNYCIAGLEGWIELKVRPDNRSPFAKWGLLRTSQRRWTRQRVSNQGRTFVLLKIKRELYLMDGVMALTIKKTTQKSDIPYLYKCTVQSWSLHTVRRILTGESNGELSQIRAA
jgi:hypothetical protein